MILKTEVKTIMFEEKIAEMNQAVMEMPVTETQPKQETDQEALIRILQNPEMAALLKTLAQSL